MRDFPYIISYHTNTWGCGIAKFNKLLSEKLNIRVVQFKDAMSLTEKVGYVSVSIAEFSESDKLYFLNTASSFENMHLILHSFSEDPIEVEIISKFKRIIGLNSAIVDNLSKFGITSVLGFAPSMLKAEKTSSQTTFKLFTFGMAHKFELGNVSRLIINLKLLGLNPSISMSTAIHLGEQPLDHLQSEIEELSSKLETPINFLGFLSDYSLYEKMIDSDAIFRFFPDGVRGNSTSVMSSLSLGRVTITNLDNQSPKWLKHFVNVVDINQWSRGEQIPATIGEQASLTYEENCKWSDLIDCIKLDNYLT